jgi:hypothetical protein
MPLLVTASVPVGPREAPEPTSIATLVLMPLVMLLNPPPPRLDQVMHLVPDGAVCALITAILRIAFSGGHDFMFSRRQ